MPYENLPGSSTSRFSVEKTDPEEYVETGRRRSVQIRDSRVQPGLHGFPGPTLKKRVLSNMSPCKEKNDEKMDEKDDDDGDER